MRLKQIALRLPTPPSAENPAHVLVTDGIYKRGKQLIDQLSASGFTVDIQGAMDGDALCAYLQAHPVAAILLKAQSKLTRAALEAAPQLCFVGRVGVGKDNLDLAAARDLGIRVMYTPGVNADAVAEAAFWHMLNLSRRFPSASDLLRSHVYSATALDQGVNLVTVKDFFANEQGLYGKRLGLYGFGNIAQAIARRAQIFGMSVYWHSRRAQTIGTCELGCRVASLEELLRMSDIFSINVDLTPETKKQINAERLKLLPDGALVINTARGLIVDPPAILAELRAGRLKYGTDVFFNEPQLSGDDLELISLPAERVSLTPHNGGGTVDANDRGIGLVVKALTEYFFERRDIEAKYQALP